MNSARLSWCNSQPMGRLHYYQWLNRRSAARMSLGPDKSSGIPCHYRQATSTQERLAPTASLLARPPVVHWHGGGLGNMDNREAFLTLQQTRPPITRWIAFAANRSGCDRRLPEWDFLSGNDFRRPLHPPPMEPLLPARTHRRRRVHHSHSRRRTRPRSAA